MKKVIVIIVLLIIITATFAFVFLKASSNNSDNSFFNSKLRHKFSQSYFLRQIFSLHNDGDAKSDYLGSRSKEIVIEIDSMQGMEINDTDLFERLSNKIEDITKKRVSYIHSTGDITYRPNLKIEEIETIKLNYGTHKPNNNKSVIYIFLGSQLEENSDQLGSTLGNDGIVLFTNTLLSYMKDYTANDYDEIVENFALGTLLHEFGHQIGLPHNNTSGCLMNESAEFKKYMNPEKIITDFCDFELDQIERMIN